MALTQAQKTLIENARRAGGGELGSGLTDGGSAYILSCIIKDLDLLDQFPEVPGGYPAFFDVQDPETLEIPNLDFYGLVERLLEIVPDADTYFACLATLQKSRIKYSRILHYQPIPTMDQVGPRALLQYGHMSAEALAGFLLWRKWIFDIDNRAGQETGYLFEPIIASAIGGAPFSARKSPVKRRSDPSKGRQVDCIRMRYAYEIKLRVTIAASGQGRWGEELDFPLDCRESGFVPVLIVLDPTPNPKLTELIGAFEGAGGHAYIGAGAWVHLEEAAGSTMSLFLERYVHQPIAAMLESNMDHLPEISFSMNEERFQFSVGEENISYKRDTPKYEDTQ